MTRARKQHESLWEHVPCTSEEWQTVAFSSLISLPQLAAQGETVWRPAVTLNFLPSNMEAGRRPLHTFLHPDIVHHCCREADKGTVLCSMAWAKLVISLWDNPEGLKWYLVGLVKSFEEFQQMNEILLHKRRLCRSNPSEFDQSSVCKSLT